MKKYRLGKSDLIVLAAQVGSGDSMKTGVDKIDHIVDHYKHTVAPGTFIIVDARSDVDFQVFDMRADLFHKTYNEVVEEPKED